MRSHRPSVRMWVVGLLLFTFTVLVPLARPPLAVAQLGMSITPATRTVALVPGSTANAVFTVRNDTDVDRTITVTAANLPTAGGAYSAVVDVNGFLLSPGTERTITVTFTASAAAVPGTYAGIQVTVSAVPNAGQSGAITLSGLVNLTVIDPSLPPRVYLPLVVRA